MNDKKLAVIFAILIVLLGVVGTTIFYLTDRNDVLVGDVTVLSHTYKVDDNGWMHVSGRVKINNESIDKIIVSAYMYNKAGNKIDTAIEILENFSYYAPVKFDLIQMKNVDLIESYKLDVKE
jgi:hypothetical protein